YLWTERRTDRSRTFPHKFSREFCDHGSFGQMISKVLQVDLSIVEKETIVRVGFFILEGKGTFADIKLPGTQRHCRVIINLLCCLNGFLRCLLLLYSTLLGMGIGQLDSLNS